MPFQFAKVAPFIFVWLWSTGFIGAKYGLPYIEPFFMLFIRFLFVLLIFFALVNFYRSKWLDMKQASQQILIGTLIHGAYLAGVFFAIKEGVPAGVAAIIVGLQPIMTSIIGKLFLAEPVNTKQSIGLILGFVGICLVIAEKFTLHTGSISMLGLIACIIALFSISIGTLLQKQLASHTPLLSGSFFQYIGALFVVGILTITTEQQVVIYSWELIGAMSWLVFGLSVLAILLLLYMIREGEVAKVTSYFYLVTPVAVFQTWLLFDEKLGVYAILGALLTVIGVVIVVKNKPTTN